MNLRQAVSLSLALTASSFAMAWAAGGHGHSELVGEPGDAAAVDREVEIVMRDTYFEPEAVAVTEGETVRFTIENEGELVHEFNIGTPHMHEEHQQEMATMMEQGMIEVDRINHEKVGVDMGGSQTMAHDDPNSVLLEPGQEAEIVWIFSKNAQLEFACNVPGHYESGMVGEIRFR